MASGAELYACFLDKEGKKEDVENAQVLIIGYDNERPLKPDISKLEQTYSKYNYRIVTLKNKSRAELLTSISTKDTFQSSQGNPFDLLFVHVLAHGSSGGVIHTHIDNETFTIEELCSGLNTLDCFTNCIKVYNLGSCRGVTMERRFNVGREVPSSSATSFQDPPDDEAKLIQYVAVEKDAIFYFATVEGHLAINRNSGGSDSSRDGTDVTKAFCQTLSYITSDTSLEVVLTETNRHVFTNSGMSNNSVTYSQTPVAHFSVCEKRLFFNNRQGCSAVPPVLPPIDFKKKSRKITDYSKMPKNSGWYGDQNDDFSKRGPGRVIIFHDVANSGNAKDLAKVSAEKFPHFNVTTIKVSNGVVMSDELDNISEILEHEYVLHIFFLTEIKREGSRISLPRFGVENVNEIINYFTAKNCPTMSGKPKIFYILDDGIGVDAQHNVAKNVFKNTGHTHSDVLCFIAKYDGLHNKIGEIIEDLVENQGIDLANLFIGLKPQQKRNMFFALTRCNNTKTLERILDEIKPQDRNKALFEACKLGHVECVELLLEKGAKLDDVPNWKGCFPLHLAAYYGNVKMFQKLLKKRDMNINIKSSGSGKTPFHFAAEGGHFKMVEWLTKQKDIDVHARDKTQEWDAYRFAIKRKNIQLAKFILDNEFNVNQRNRRGYSLLHLCILDKNNSRNISNKIFQDPFYKEVLKMLLQRVDKSNIDAKSNLNGVLHFAAERCDAESVEILIEAGADPYLKGENDLSYALHIAVLRGRAEEVRRLLQEGSVPVDTRMPLFKETALHFAAIKCYEEIVRILLENGLDVNAKNKNGNAALHIAVMRGFERVVKVLVEADNIQIDIQGEAEQTALHWAAFKGYEEIVAILLEKNADINAKDENEDTPLHFAASSKNRIGIVKKLLENDGLDVNATDNQGETALHRAAARNNTEAVRLLLEHKDIKINIKSKSGETARDMTRNQEIIEMLDEAKKNKRASTSNDNSEIEPPTKKPRTENS